MIILFFINQNISYLWGFGVLGLKWDTYEEQATKGFQELRYGKNIPRAP